MKTFRRPFRKWNELEEYAIAVRGGEHQLLSVIDGVIGKAKQDGTLARLFKEATQEFEDARAVTGGSRAGDTAQERPWLCSR